MAKFLIPKTFQVDGFATVAIDSRTPDLCEVTFQVENELRTYQLGRQQLEQLGRDIAAKLKAAPLPARGQKAASERSPNDK